MCSASALRWRPRAARPARPVRWTARGSGPLSSSRISWRTSWQAVARHVVWSPCHMHRTRPCVAHQPSFTGSGPWQAVASCTPLERDRFGRTHPAQCAAALLEQSARPAPGPLRCLRITAVRRGAGRAATAWRPTLRPSWRPSRPSAHSSRCSSPRWCTRPRACTPGSPGPLSRPRAL